MGLAAGVGSVIQIIPITNVNNIRSETDVWWSRASAPGPTVVRNKGRSASTVDVILAIALDDGGRIVDADLPGKRKGNRSQH